MDCHIFANNSHITQTSSKLDQSSPTHHQHILKVDPTHHQKRSVLAIRFCRFGQNVPDIGEKSKQNHIFHNFSWKSIFANGFTTFLKICSPATACGWPACARLGCAPRNLRGTSEEFRGVPRDHLGPPRADSSQAPFPEFGTPNSKFGFLHIFHDF